MKRLTPAVLLADLATAIGGVLGPALLLDARLRVLAVTPAARGILPAIPAPGDAFPALLGDRRGADTLRAALAAGQPATVLVECRGRRDQAALRLRATPLGASAQGGWLLFVGALSGDVAEGVEQDGLWTADPAMLRLFEIIRKVAATDARVLVRGETGSGKELVARAVHTRSRRARGPFRAINCAALPPALLESELFGHVRGAFTGAVRDYPGHFRLADGGSLFLDEVGEMPAELQAKLLRVVETGTVIPVGGRDPVEVDVRLIAATHRSLRAETAAGRFRADLMYRLRVVPLFVPPLRARPADVRLLAGRFLAELSARGGRAIERVADEAWAALLAYPWPGNVRELRNVLEYAWVIGDGPVLLLADLPPELRGDEPPAPAHDASLSGPPAPAPAPLGARRRRPGAHAAAAPSAEAIRAALSRSLGAKADAAAALGLSRTTLWRRMRELGMG